MDKFKEPIIKFSFIVSLLIIGSALIMLFDVRAIFEQIEFFIIHAGAWAPLWFIAIYTFFTIFLLPILQLNVFAGIAFGSFAGSLYVTIGVAIGSVVAFWIARDYGYKLVHRLLSKYISRLDKIQNMIEKNGFVTVLVLRLIPVMPFGGLSFFLGLTSVRFRDYFLGTMLGMVPWTIVYVYFGNSLKEQNALKAFGALSVILIGILAGKLYKEMEK